MLNLALPGFGLHAALDPFPFPLLSGHCRFDCRPVPCCYDPHYPAARRRDGYCRLREQILNRSGLIGGSNS